MAPRLSSPKIAVSSRVQGGILANTPAPQGASTPVPLPARPVAASAATPVDWTTLITAAMASPLPSTKANTLIKRYDDDSKPIEVICDDGHTYVVKSLWADPADRPADAEVKHPRTDAEQGRRMFNDQFCGRLGAAMGAPVPHIGLVEITAQLINANPKTMGHLKPCVGHGSRRVPDVTGKVGGFDHADKGDNRTRYGKLAIFYGWLVHGDMQFIRGTQPPYAVYSHDHGHFFPGGPMWTQASLAAYATDPEPVQQIVTALNLAPAEIAQAADALAAVTVSNIIEAAAAAAANWQVEVSDRAALAAFVHQRQSRMVQAINAPATGAAP